MGAPRSEEAYPDSREFLNKAIESEKGWRATFMNRGEATNFRLRCYAARGRQLSIEMRFNKGVKDYLPRTVWDGLVLFLKETEHGWAVIAMKDDGEALQNVVVEQGPVE